MPKLALGTVQIGMNYGINNKIGKPSKEEAFAILDKAYNNGIEMLDTAYVYGDSEKRIGEYIYSTGNSFEICSKLPHTDFTNDNVVKYFESSLERLKKDKIEYYLLHDIREAKKEVVLDKLMLLKEKKLIDNIGVSIYDIQDVETVLTKECFTAIQIPMNVFDRRIKKAGYLDEFKKKNIKIFIRSIFLQGLFFKDYNRLPPKFDEAKEYIKMIKEISNKYNLNITDLIFSWFKYNNYGDYLLFGVETKQQLLENIKSYNKNVEESIINEFNELVNDIRISNDSIIIDPRRW